MIINITVTKFQKRLININQWNTAFSINWYLKRFFISEIKFCYICILLIFFGFFCCYCHFLRKSITLCLTLLWIFNMTLTNKCYLSLAISCNFAIFWSDRHYLCCSFSSIICWSLLWRLSRFILIFLIYFVKLIILIYHCYIKILSFWTIIN